MATPTPADGRHTLAEWISVVEMALGAEDDEEAARLTTAALREWAPALAALRAVRQDAVTGLHESGLTWDQVGQVIGTSRVRAAGIGAGVSSAQARRRRAERGPVEQGIVAISGLAPDEVQEVNDRNNWRQREAAP